MKTDALLKTARLRMDEAAEADQSNRERAEGDLEFLIGEQWPENARTAREADNKPCLTINSLPQFVRQVTGQIRQINPAIKVIAGDNAASKDVAEVKEGLLRQIQYKCDAPSIFEGAAERAAASSVGHFRIRTDYCDERSFDQEILIEPIYNPFAVFCDPLAKHPTRRDARFMFVVDEMARDDFKADYPDAEANDLTSEHRPEFWEHWLRTDSIVVAEYFWVEHTDVTIGMLPDGQVIEKPEAIHNVIKKRTARVPKVMWAKITASDVLEGPIEMPCSQIPVIFVTGEEWHIGEELYRSSVVRFAKDPQQLYNYSRSALAESIALQPKAPYMVTTKQIAGLEELWRNANTANAPYLPYNPDAAAPPPMRVPPPVPSQGLTQEIMLAADDMKRTTGIYDASLGNRSNETSGVAIRERQQEAQMGNSVYTDNMVKAIHQAGRLIVEMIPRVYDTQRVIRILGEDDQETMVQINAVMQSIDGPVAINDMTMGKYDVRVQVGPAHDTKREAAADGVMEFMRTVPQSAPLIGDLVAKMQDWDESDRIADRLRKMLPPGVLDPDEMPEEMRAQVAQQQRTAQQAQEDQQQFEQMRAEIDMQKQKAEADEAGADAQKAALEVTEKQLELAIASGQMDAAINDAVNRALSGILQPAGYPPQF